MPNKRQRKKNTKKYGTGKTIYNFPVGDKTLETYRREVKNTKAKINRVKKEHGIDLSEVIPIPSLESFSSRSEFNKWTKFVKEEFRNPRNDQYQFIRNQHNVSSSKRRLKEIEKKVKESQKLADEQIKKYEDKPFVSGGEVQGTVGMQRPNKTGIYRPHDFNFNDVKSRQRLDEIEESAFTKTEPEYYDERKQRMKDNFIEALSGSFNSIADKLIKEIKKINPDDFYEIYLMFDEFDFDYFDTEGELVTADEKSVGEMMKYVSRYSSGQLNTDMWNKNFN